MKTRFRTISGALALTVMLLFSAVAFAHANTSGANPNMSASAMPSARFERWKNRRHRRHMRREIRRERGELREKR